MSNNNTVPSAKAFIASKGGKAHNLSVLLNEYTRLHLEAIRDELTSGDEKVVLIRDIEKTINNYIKNNKL